MTADPGDTDDAREPTTDALRDQHVGSTATTSSSTTTSTTTAEIRPITVAETSPDPPLPYDEEPPLPDGPVPNEADDGWEAKWDDNAQAWYFYNHRTGVSQWENPRVPEATAHSYEQLPSSTTGAPGTSSPPKRIWGGYNPAIHGSYDPNADYAKEAMREQETEAEVTTATTRIQHPNDIGYASEAQFNRFTGKFQQAGVGPELHNDENKSKRQMAAFFDVDAAANSHDGRSLKAERRGKTLTKKELHAFKEKRHKKKEEKRRAFYRD